MEHLPKDKRGKDQTTALSNALKVSMDLTDKYRNQLKIIKSIAKNQTTDLTRSRKVLEAALKENEELRLKVVTVEAKLKESEKLFEEENELRMFLEDKYAREKYRAEDLLADNKGLSDRNKALEKVAEEWKIMLVEEEEEKRDIQCSLCKAEEKISDLDDQLEEETEKAKHASKSVEELKELLEEEVMEKDAAVDKLTKEILKTNDLNEQLEQEVKHRLDGETKIEELLTLLEEEIEINKGKKKPESQNPARIQILESLLSRRKYRCDEPDDVDVKVEKRTKQLQAILADEIEKKKNSQKKEEKAKNLLRKEKRKRKNLKQCQKQNETVSRKHEKEIEKRKQAQHALYQEKFLREEIEAMLNNKTSHNQALERRIEEDAVNIDELKKLLEIAVEEKTIFEKKFHQVNAEAEHIETQLMNKFCRIVDLEKEVQDLKQIIAIQNTRREKSDNELLEEQKKIADLKKQINAEREKRTDLEQYAIRLLCGIEGNNPVTAEKEREHGEIKILTAPLQENKTKVKDLENYLAWKIQHFQEVEMTLRSEAEKRKIAEQKIIEISALLQTQNRVEKVKCTEKATKHMQGYQNNSRESKEENHAEKQISELRESLTTKNEEINILQNFIILEQQKTNDLQIMLHEEIEKKINLTEEMEKLDERLDKEIKKRFNAEIEAKAFQNLLETEMRVTRDLENKAQQCQLKIEELKMQSAS